MQPESKPIEPTDPDSVEASKRNSGHRVAIASFIGTMVEQYDFIIYGTAAALVFPKILFPALGPAAGTAVSFATFGVAFVARPFGGILFGHFGDRLGRKATLVTTLMLMGGATILVGAVPTAAQIGIWAPIIVVMLRIVQGLAAGGEWAGAVLFSAEHAPKSRRGLWVLAPLLGGNVAFALANLTFLITGLGMSEETFATWGWRLPFLSSIVLIVVGLWARLKIDETPVFIKAKEAMTGQPRKFPFFESLKSQPREILLAGGIGLTVFSFFYVSGTFLVTYATGTLHLTRPFVLACGVGAGVVLTLSTVCGSLLSDRVGRRPVLLGASIVGIVWALVIFPILGSSGGSGTVFAIALCVTMAITGLGYGPMGTLIPELFHTRYRYTATGFSYNLGTVIGGALAPIIAAPIVAAYGINAFGIFLAVLCAIAVTCTLLLRETRGISLDTLEASTVEAYTS